MITRVRCHSAQRKRVRRLPDIPREARVFATVCGLLLSLSILLHEVLDSSIAVDMLVYREGVHVFFDGGSLYSQPLTVGDSEQLPFIYPPFGALALSPFAVSFLSDAAACRLIVLINGLLIGLCTWLVARAAFRSYGAPSWEGPAATLTWALAMCLEPFTSTNGYGQVNVIIMTLVVLDLVPRRRYLPRGCLLGIAAAIKLTPLVMLLYFLLRRSWRPILNTAGTICVAWGLAAVVRWDTTVEYFTETLLNMGSRNEFGVSPAANNNGSLKGMIMRWFANQDALAKHSLLVNCLWLAASLIVLAICVVIMRRLFHLGMPMEAWCINALLMLLISPISWTHHWVWLCVIFPVAAVRLILLNECSLLAWLLGIWAGLCATYPLQLWVMNNGTFDTLNLWEKLLLADNTWFALITLALLYLRTAPSKLNCNSAHPRSTNPSPRNPARA